MSTKYNFINFYLGELQLWRPPPQLSVLLRTFAQIISQNMKP